MDSLRHLCHLSIGFKFIWEAITTATNKMGLGVHSKHPLKQVRHISRGHLTHYPNLDAVGNKNLIKSYDTTQENLNICRYTCQMVRKMGCTACFTCMMNFWKNALCQCIVTFYLTKEYFCAIIIKGMTELHIYIVIKSHF